MTDLLTKHGAASKLGITSAALGKLVRENKVPYVKLPNGDIRFDAGDLNNWVQKLKGGDMTTATITEREQLQEYLRKRPEYIEQRNQLQKKLDEIQVKVDAGELTEMALVKTQSEWTFVTGLIGKIDNRFRNDLVNSCTNQDLRDEQLELRDRKDVVNREITYQNKCLERIETNIRILRTDHENLVTPNGNSDEYQPFTHDEAYQKRITKKEREWKTAKKSKSRCEAKIQDLKDQLQEIHNQEARVKEEMIYYEES